jgi:magnesium transporter
MTSQELNRLLRELRARVPADAAEILEREPSARVDEALGHLPQQFATRIAAHLPDALRPARYAAADDKSPDTVDELMEAPRGVLPPNTTVARAIEFIRTAEDSAEITYLYVAEYDMKLRGLLVLRELLLADPQQTLEELMITNPYRFQAGMEVLEAVKAAARRQYPVYPVCDADGKLVGLVRGWRLMEAQAFEISAQSGRMVGVSGEERIETPAVAAFKMRHPWLQVNLLTAFLDVFVVGMFSGTIEKVVALAAFLPVLAGQSGNTGCQTLAITLRGMTLGELDAFPIRKLFFKEMRLGLFNGLCTGVPAGLAMWWYAAHMGTAHAEMLALTVWLAMTGGCLVASTAGVLIPLTLKRFGADPVTASAIFLTTCTDIAGMGLMLVLATSLVPGI